MRASSSNSYRFSSGPIMWWSLVAAAIVVLAAARGATATAMTCSPVQLSSCASAIRSATPPSKLCCAKIKEQRPCLCQYMKNPAVKPYVNTPNARKVASTCGTPFPKC